MRRNLTLLLPILLFLLILILPPGFLGLEGLTIVEQRVIAIFVLAACYWILEPIPVYTTSLLIIFLQLVLISDKGLKFLMSGGSEALGSPLSYRAIMANFGSPILILFLGGFFLAIAATKYRLDRNLARVLLRPFGNKPTILMMGIMLITALFSMFMSNTAATAMFLSILGPVLAVFPPGDRGRKAFLLAIPVAANIGGIGTPIGTPPNAIALKYLTGPISIGFGEWMAFGVPFVVVLLAISWVLLQVFFPMDKKPLKLALEGRFQQNWKAYTVYSIFGLTILLWLTDFIHGMNAYVVAMLPVAAFSMTAIVNREDLKLIGWDVLWLVAGGIALGASIEQSGLASRLVGMISFDALPVLVVILAITFIALVMANLMSHTATANLLLPLVAAIGAVMEGITDLGGVQMLIVATTLACSLGMSLPISTPPNALAFGSGEIKTGEMARIGVLVGIIGLIAVYGTMFILSKTGFFTSATG